MLYLQTHLFVRMDFSTVDQWNFQFPIKQCHAEPMVTCSFNISELPSKQRASDIRNKNKQQQIRPNFRDVRSFITRFAHVVRSYSMMWSGRLPLVKYNGKFQTIGPKSGRGCCMVPNILNWLGIFWLFGKVVANGRWSLTIGGRTREFYNCIRSWWNLNRCTSKKKLGTHVKLAIVT